MSPRLIALLAPVALLASACKEGGSAPACGSNDYEGHALLPGPAEPAHDAALARRAEAFDRQFHALNAWSTGVTADVQLRPDDAAGRGALEQFVREGKGSIDAASLVTRWGKAAGLYAGVGIAADAYRYGTLRGQGAACDAIAEARDQFVRGLQALHLASEITGTPGVIARGFIRRDLPGGKDLEPLPLFDAAGQPLPAEKDNGQWRADRSGKHPDYLWDDSCSRDMLLGWAQAFSAAFEVGRDDATLPAALLATLRADAAAIARGLMTVRGQGYDLELPDADGRTTFHGYLNENAVERTYIPGARNGFHALMALGIVGALASAADEADITAWLRDELVGARGLPEIAVDGLASIYMGEKTNGSGVNMAFNAMWLALRHPPDENTRTYLAEALHTRLYAPEDPSPWRPSELGQSLFDFIDAAYSGDAGALARGLRTLAEFPDAPYFGVTRINCDEAEIAARRCTLVDGSTVELSAGSGRGDALVAKTPLPMRARPPSNYWWRSNPYTVNGESTDGTVLSGVDFRFAYWLGRWARVSPP